MWCRRAPVRRRLFARARSSGATSRFTRSEDVIGRAESSLTYRPSLDGLRALAMYVIVLFHTQVSWAMGGFIAVNLFFVLSGYLVTTVILTEIDRKGRLDLARFYARRVRRLLPAALVAVVGISLLFLMVVPVVRRVGLIADGQSALLYYANWHFIAQSTDYFATDVEKSPYLHFWTLSIEEQFYVFFPLLLVLLLKFGGRRAAVIGMTAVTGLSLAAQFYWAHAMPIHAYFGTDARAYQLLVGVVLALVLHWRPPQVTPRVATALAAAGGVGFVVLCAPSIPLSQAMRGVAGTVACVLLVAGLMFKEDQPLGRALSHRVPVYLGQISYSTYLWHWPAILVMDLVLDVRPIVMATLAAILATAVASASAELLELPFRRAKRLEKYNWRVVGTGLTASVLAAVLAIPMILSWQRQPDLVAEKGSKGDPAVIRAGKQPEQAPKDVDWKQVEQDKGRSVSCGPDDSSDCTLHEGKGPHVLLVGDSHAAMLADMWLDLAKKHDFTFSLNSVLGCPWQENLQNIHSGKDRQKDCTDARVGWYDDVLPKLDPDIVVLAGFPREDEKRWGKTLVQRNGRHDDLPKATLRATRQSLRKINKVADRVLLTETVVTPNTFDPNECITSAKDARECAVPVKPETSVTDAYYLTEVTENEGFYSVNLNRAFCPAAPICQPVVDGKIVWRDNEHLTPDYAASRADQAWKFIKKSGIFDGMKVKD